MLNKKEILELVKQIESFTGIQCIHINELQENATNEEYYHAWILDRTWFKGYADTILTII